MISCVIRSPADYMAEWENVPLDPTTKKKKKKKKKQRVNLEPPRPMAARLIKCAISTELLPNTLILV